jgi:hypothetical protein
MDAGGMMLLLATMFALSAEAARWFSHVQYLASDRLEGRNTGTRGYRLAADYVAKQFAEAGLEPAGHRGYFQPVDYIVRRTDSKRSRVMVGDRELVIGRDVVLVLRGTGDASKHVDTTEGDPKLAIIRSSEWEADRSDAALPNAVLAEAALREPKERPLTIVVSPDAAPLFTKGARIRADHVITTKRVTAPNVVGMIRGSDPSESVVVSAHLDHLGIGLPVNGDAIYNGAMDNASGVATIIEIARELHARGVKPRRSIVFLAPGAEEDGSYGSWYFVHHQLPKGTRVAADLNVDGASAFYPFRRVMAVGSDSLQAAVAAAADANEVKVVPDPAPERNTVAGSDQYSFILAGIPALLVRATAPDTDGRKLIISIMQKAYHQPADDLQLPWKPEYAPDFVHFMAEAVTSLSR